MSELIAEK